LEDDFMVIGIVGSRYGRLVSPWWALLKLPRGIRGLTLVICPKNFVGIADRTVKTQPGTKYLSVWGMNLKLGTLRQQGLTGACPLIQALQPLIGMMSWSKQLIQR
jgi:hypothetical protein